MSTRDNTKNIQNAQDNAGAGLDRRPAPQQIGDAAITTTDSSDDAGHDLIDPDVAGVPGNTDDGEHGDDEDDRQAAEAFAAEQDILRQQREDDAIIAAAAARAKSEDTKTMIPLADAARRAGIKAEDLATIRGTKKQLDAAEKIPVMIAQATRGAKPLPDVVVTINDYSYQIKRGALVYVPMPVAEVLVNSGHLLPMTPHLMQFSRDAEPEVARTLQYA